MKWNRGNLICEQIFREAISFQAYVTKEAGKFLFLEENVVAWQKDTFRRFWWHVSSVLMKTNL